MSGSLRIDGLRELREQLRGLPTELAEEARGIVRQEAEQAEQEAGGEYRVHEVRGGLRAGLMAQTPAATRFAALTALRSRAPHSHLFEYGTKARTYTGTDKRGRKFQNASRGVMGEHRAFLPAVIRHREAMYRRLAELLRRAGFVVTGHAP